MKTYTAEDLQRTANAAAALASNTMYRAARLLLEQEAQKSGRRNRARLVALIAQLDAMPAIEGVNLKPL